jgi:hypothetical protein
MRLLSIIVLSSCVAAFVATPANAEPITAALTAALVTAGLSATTAAIVSAVIITVVQVGLSLALSLLTRPDAPRLTPTNLSQQLAQPNSLPPVRFAYGRVLLQGSPAPWRVKNNVLYGCLILNSRASDGGNMTIRVDRETLSLTGDAFDFTASGGATPTTGVISGHFKVWVGLGEQTGPPAQVVTEAGDIFSATDAWEGLTVAWVRCDAGPASSFRERWAGSPPEIEFLMNWSKVWDPRDTAQSSDDPSTWVWSENQGLCALDAEMQNPKEPLPLNQIDLDAFKVQADVADEDVALAAGGTEKRYTTGGILAFSTQELHAAIAPLYQAGASYRIRNGGRRSIAPGRYEAPTLTISDFVAPEISIETLRPSRRLATYVRTSFVNKDVGYEDAELEQYEVPGAAAEDGGQPIITNLALDFVVSATQAMRITKIEAHNLRRQLSVKFTAWPETVQLVNGSPVTLDLPGYEMADGVYRTESIRPLGIAVGEGVALQCQLSLLEWSDVPYQWTTAEEFEVTTGAQIDVVRSGIVAPASLSFTSGATAALDTGGGVTLPRLLVSFPPSTSNSVESYEIEYRKNGSGDSYELAGAAPSSQTDGSGDVFFYITDVTAGEMYDVRVRAVSDFGKSEYITSTGVTVSAPTATVSPPSDVSAASAGQTAIDVTATSPNDTDYRGLTIWINTTNTTAGATQALGPVYGAASMTDTYNVTGLTASTTYYLWARSVDSFGELSTFSSVASATTDDPPGGP